MAIRYQFGYGCTANLSKAKELYNKALYWNSNIAENNLGAIFMKEGNLEQAKRLFNRAIAEKSHYRHGKIKTGVQTSCFYSFLKYSFIDTVAEVINYGEIIVGIRITLFY